MLPINEIRKNLDKTLDGHLADGRVDSDHQRQLNGGFFWCGTFSDEGDERTAALDYFKDRYGETRTGRWLLNVARDEVLRNQNKVYGRIPDELRADKEIKEKIGRVLELPAVDITKVRSDDTACYGGPKDDGDGKVWLG